MKFWNWLCFEIEYFKFFISVSIVLNLEIIFILQYFIIFKISYVVVFLALLFSIKLVKL